MASEDDPVWRSARASHPDIDLAADVFSAFVEARRTSCDNLAGRAADLYLACACLHGSPRAAEAFVRQCLDRVPVYLGRGHSAEVVQEVQQLLAIKFLVDDDGPPLIGRYEGRGPLEAWVRVTAVRAAMTLERGERRRARWEGAVEERITGVAGELAAMKQVYREPFKIAFADAIRALARTHRALLRLHYMQGMSNMELAKVLGTSRATIIRRLGDARSALADEVARLLRERLGLAKEEFDSLMRLVWSEVEGSLARHLRETPA